MGTPPRDSMQNQGIFLNAMTTCNTIFEMGKILFTGKLELFLEMSFFFYSGVHVSKAKISFSSISLCFVF
jgi:hypothetical protein